MNKTETKEKVKEVGGKINDGKCCRCTFYKMKKCSNKNNKNKFGKYTPRKFGCNLHKYKD